MKQALIYPFLSYRNGIPHFGILETRDSNTVGSELRQSR